MTTIAGIILFLAILGFAVLFGILAMFSQEAGAIGILTGKAKVATVAVGVFAAALLAGFAIFVALDLPKGGNSVILTFVRNNSEQALEGELPGGDFFGTPAPP